MGGRLEAGRGDDAARSSRCIYIGARAHTLTREAQGAAGREKRREVTERER